VRCNVPAWRNVPAALAEPDVPAASADQVELAALAGRVAPAVRVAQAASVDLGELAESAVRGESAERVAPVVLADLVVLAAPVSPARPEIVPAAVAAITSSTAVAETRS
jgi:hypothetical protein